MARVTPIAVGLLVLSGMLALASLGTTFGYLACVVAAGLVATLVLGPERLGVVAMVAAMFTATMDDLRPVASFVTYSDLFFVLGIGLLLPQLFRNRGRLPSMYVGGAALLLVAGLLASILAADQALSLNGLSRLVAASIALPVAFAYWRPNVRIIDVMAGAYVAGMVVNVVVGIAQGPLSNNRYVGLTTHPNYFGMSALLSVGLLIYLLDRVPAKRRWVLYAAGLVCLLGIVESGSRAALLVFIVLVAIYPLVERSVMAGYGILVTGGILVVVGGLLLDSFIEGSAIDRLRGDNTSSYSDTKRTGLLEAGFHQFLQKPFLGWGFTDDPLASHNVYLEVAVALGVVGLVAWCMILWTLVRPLLSVDLARHRLAYPALAYALLALLTNTMWDRSVWAAIALALLVGPRDDDSEPETAEGDAGVLRRDATLENS